MAFLTIPFRIKLLCYSSKLTFEIAQYFKVWTIDGNTTSFEYSLNSFDHKTNDTQAQMINNNGKFSNLPNQKAIISQTYTIRIYALIALYTTTATTKTIQSKCVGIICIVEILHSVELKLSHQTGSTISVVSSENQFFFLQYCWEMAMYLIDLVI